MTGPARREWRAAALAVAAALMVLPGCYAPQLAMLRSGQDSLRAQIDTLQARDEQSAAVIAAMRKEVADQRDILLSTRATAGSTTQEMFEQMEKLNTRLDEVLSRFNQVSQRSGTTTANPPTTPAAPDPNQLFDQATSDLTQGRYPLAVQEFREFVRRFPTSEMADNAQYGIGEGFFAEARFDSAAVEYARVGTDYPQGDKRPAALYKLGLSQEKLGDSAASKRTLQDLIKKYPQSGEAQLARERLGSTTTKKK